MDAAHLDAVSAVLGAIAASAGAGAGAAVKDMTKTAIMATRDRLVALVRGRLKKDPVGDAKLTVYAAEPTPANGQALHRHLIDAGVDQDQEILTLAREVLQAAIPASIEATSAGSGVGRHIDHWDPAELGVHASITGPAEAVIAKWLAARAGTGDLSALEVLRERARARGKQTH